LEWTCLHCRILMEVVTTKVSSNNSNQFFCVAITWCLKYFSSKVLFLSIYLLIWGWLIIKNFSLVPIKLNNVVHNLLVSRTSRSLTMFDGTSMYFNIFRSNNPAIASTVHTVEVVMDTIYLVNLSLTIIHTQNNVIHKK